MKKSELRAVIRQCKRSYSQTQLEAWSLDVLERLKQVPRFQAAKTVLLYYSLPDEVLTHALLDELEGKVVLLPRVISDCEMELRRYTGKKDLWQGAFGIMEPCGEVFTDYPQIDVAVIPGIAFDAKGHRLGRGRGYYDRFLARVPYIYKIGLCFRFQLVDDVPTDEGDVPVDVVIS